MKIKSIMLLITITILILIVILYGGYKMHTNIIKKAIAEQEKYYKSEIEKLNRLIREKETMLRLSEQRYGRLKNQIQKKAEEAASVKPPETDEELKNRFSNLGFKPTR